MDRLKIANPDIERPVIWLGLDGLDEDIAQGPREDIRQILRWFWHRDEEARAGQTPLATLIVTYRSRNQLRHWLKLPYDYPGDTPLSFELDYFSEEEAERALAMIFPDILGRNSGMGADETSLTLEDRDWFSPEQPTISSRREYRIEPEIFQTLRHPVMWRALLYLSDDLSRQVLLGNQDAIRLWAEAYIRWFFDKLRRRNSLLVGDLRELEELLHAVAVRSQNYPRLRRNNHWVQPMCDTDLVNVTMATELYNEARSGGLIAQDERNNWRWQHELVRDYLIEVR